MERDQIFIHVKVCPGITVRHGVISVMIMPHVDRDLLPPLLYHVGHMMAHLVLGKRVFVGMCKLALLLRGRGLRLRVLVSEPSRKAVSPLLLYVPYNDIQHHGALLAVASVHMLCRPPVRVCRAPGRSEGELYRYPLYVLCRDAAYLFSPFRSERFKIFGQPVGRVVCPFVNELLVVKPFLHDG